MQISHSATCHTRHHGERFATLHQGPFTQAVWSCVCNPHCKRLHQCFSIRTECRGSASSILPLLMQNLSYLQGISDQVILHLFQVQEGDFDTRQNMNCWEVQLLFSQPSCQHLRDHSLTLHTLFGDGSAFKTRRTPLLVMLAAIAGPSRDTCLGQL